ncbi:MAG: hypothetical protein ACFFD2_08920 [Promethearchaeota archaeon]
MFKDILKKVKAQKKTKEKAPKKETKPTEAIEEKKEKEKQPEKPAEEKKEEKVKIEEKAPMKETKPKEAIEEKKEKEKQPEKPAEEKKEEKVKIEEKAPMKETKPKETIEEKKEKEKQPEKPAEEKKEEKVKTEEKKGEIKPIPVIEKKKMKFESDTSAPILRYDIKFVMEKYRKILLKNKNLTIQEFVKRLKLNPQDPLYIKSVTPEEAVEILVIIALSSIPFGLTFRSAVLNKITSNPADVSFYIIFDTLNSISLEKIGDPKLYALVRDSLKKLTPEDIQELFESEIKLKDHPFISRFIKTPSHVKIAELIGIEETTLKGLEEKAYQEEQFLAIEDEQVVSDIQIDPEKVKSIKNTTALVEIFGIKPKLAVALSEKYNIDEIGSIDLEDIKETIRNAKIAVPKSQFTDKKLKEIQTISESQTPYQTSLNKVIADLKIKTALKEYIEENEVTSLNDLKKVIEDEKEPKPILDIIAPKIKSKKKIDVLKAYIRLNKISNNFDVNKALIENNFKSSIDITHIPLFEFQNKFKDKASREELKEIYYRAQANIARNISRRALKTLKPQRAHLDYLVTKSGSQPVIMMKKKKEGDEN